MATFLQRSRHKTVYYFRRKVPRDLRRQLGAVQLYRSLGTCERRDAVVLARALAAKTDRIFSEIRAMSKDKDDEGLRTNYGLFIDLDEVTGKKQVSARDIKPGEEETARKELLALQAEVLGEGVQRSPARPAPGLPLQQAVDLYFSEDTQLKPRSKRRYAQVLADVVAHFGAGADLARIDQPAFIGYADRVKASDRSRATKANYITIAARFFKWSKIRSRTPHDISAATLKPKRQQPAWLDRAAFTADEIRAIFENAARARGRKKQAKFWVTVASAFLGGRIEELAQLDFERDLHQTADGTWFIRVQENHDEQNWRLRQSVKKMTSWRALPLHSALVRHGFIEFLLSEKRAGAKRPFERYWKPHMDEKFEGAVYSHGIVKWGANEIKKLRKLGLIKTPKVSYYHSHRHTLATELARQGVGEEIRCAIAGQEYGGINSELYSKLKDSPETLAPFIERHLAHLAVLLDEVMKAK